MNGPRVDVLIPCFDEREHIEACVRSLLASDYPRDRLCIVVIDGGSGDGTVEIVDRLAREDARVQRLHNPARLKPHGLNLAIRRSRADVVLRADAHALYPPDYVRRLVEDLERHDADNTGGIRETFVGGNAIARAIGIAVSHRFAAGDAHYRTGSARVREVESVFGGCYRREVFDRIGLFNERLVRTQDRELNRRLRAAGGRIVLDPAVRCTYFPRTDARAYWRWTWEGACWLFVARRFTDTPMVSWRNLVPLSLVAWHGLAVALSGLAPALAALLVGPVLAYWAINAGVSVHAAASRRDPALAPALFVVFAMTHFAYGLASLQGALRCALAGGKVQG